MTWTTPLGDRVLKGPEADLIISYVEMKMDHFDDDSFHFRDYKDGVKNFKFLDHDLTHGAFDSLKSYKQMNVYMTVFFYLFFPTDVPLKLNHIYEAAVHSIFSSIKEQLKNEIENGDEIFLRDFINSYKYCFPDEEIKNKIEINDMYEMMQKLSERILHDEDWMYYENNLSSDAYTRFGIDKDYFSMKIEDISDDNNSREFDRLISFLSKEYMLVQKKND